MATQKHSNIRALDDLTNRIRWAAGTLETLLEDEHLDPPQIDAISSACHHLGEVRALVGQLKPGARVFADADGNGANARLLKAGDDELRAACLELAAEKHGNSANARLLVPSYRLAHAAPDWSDDSEVYDCVTLVISHLESLLKASHHDEADFDPAMVYLAQHELRDLKAILDTWLSHRQPNQVPRVDAPTRVPEWLTRRAKDAGCTVEIEEGALNVGIASNPEGPGIIGASLAEAEQFIREHVEAQAEDTAELGYDPDEQENDPFGRNMLLREGDYIEASALIEQAKTMVRIAIQHAQDQDSIRESLIALEAVERIMERVETLIDGAQIEVQA